MTDSSMNRRALLTRGLVGATGAVVGAGGHMLLAAPMAAAASNMQYNTITPFRAYDSRDDGNNRIAESGRLYRIDVTSDMYGAKKIEGAKAITFNITVAETDSNSGFLTVLPGNVTETPTFSTINWSGRGTVLANGGTVGLGESGAATGSVNVYCGGGGRTTYLLDVTGYYK